MKYFKNSRDIVFAFEADGSQDAHISADLTPITEEERKLLTAPPTPSVDQLAATARARRNRLIADTDYMLKSDYPIDAGRLEVIKAYRQSLRDVTSLPGFPESFVWPVNPLSTQKD